MRQFREAAERVKAQKHLDSLPTEQKIVARLKAYMQEWKEDLDARASEAVNTTIGLQVSTLSSSPAISIAYVKGQIRDI